MKRHIWCLLVVSAFSNLAMAQFATKGSSRPPASKSSEDPFALSESEQLALKLEKRFRGVVRMTYSVRLENVVVHTKSSVALVLSSGHASMTTVGRAGGWSDGPAHLFSYQKPVFVTTESIFDIPKTKFGQSIPIELASKTLVIEPLNFKDLALQQKVDGSKQINSPNELSETSFSRISLGNERDISNYFLGSEEYKHAASTSTWTRQTVKGLAFVFTDADIAITSKRNVEPLTEIDTTMELVGSEGGTIYSLQSSAAPEALEGSAPKSGNFSVSENGFQRLYVDSETSKQVDYSTQQILESYLQATKERGEEIARSLANRRSIHSPESVSSNTESAGANSYGDSQGQSRIVERVANLVASWHSSQTEAEKASLKSELRSALDHQFDAQRKLRQIELAELRERLEELTKSEETKIQNKVKTIDARLEKLIGTSN